MNNCGHSPTYFVPFLIGTEIALALFTQPQGCFFFRQVLGLGKQCYIGGRNGTLEWWKVVGNQQFKPWIWLRAELGRKFSGARPNRPRNSLIRRLVGIVHVYGRFLHRNYGTSYISLNFNSHLEPVIKGNPGLHGIVLKFRNFCPSLCYDSLCPRLWISVTYTNRNLHCESLKTITSSNTFSFKYT